MSKYRIAWLPGDGIGNDVMVASRIVLERIEALPPSTVTSLLPNPDFETGVNPWWFHTNGVGSFAYDAAGNGSTHAGHVTITAPGTNVQMAQSDIVLKPLTAYTLRFAARSNTGHDVDVFLEKHGPPYTNYGLVAEALDLTSSWQTYVVTFPTKGFDKNVGDAQ